MTLSPPSPMNTLRFCSDSTPTMNTTAEVRVRQPSISSTLASTDTAYTSSNHSVESDHIRTLNASFESVSRCARSQLHGPSGPYSSRRCGNSRSRKNSQVAENPIRTTALW
ncbi:hypothetical protein EES37_08625 [Streptomyces sp. ADI91-18]|nr:hypothetical protein EES37_08625 [Streptomyces sp. ADI91-18]